MLPIAHRTPAGVGCLRCSLRLQEQPRRFRHQRDPGSLTARLIRAVTQPVLIEPRQCDTERRLRVKEERERRREQSGYLQFLVNECKRDLLDAADGRLLLVAERLPHGRQFAYPYINELYKLGVRSPRYPNEILLRASAGTKWQRFFELMAAPGVASFFAVGEADPAVCRDALKVLNRSQFLVPLGGVVEDRMLNVKQLEEFSQLPDLQACRSQLLAILNSPAAQLLGTTSAKATELVAMLADRESKLS